MLCERPGVAAGAGVLTGLATAGEACTTVVRGGAISELRTGTPPEETAGAVVFAGGAATEVASWAGATNAAVSETTSAPMSCLVELDIVVEGNGVETAI